jgi:MtrB/PioB family decaheme-associated outer membrane protein
MLAAAGALLVAWNAPAIADGYVNFGTEWWDQSAPEAKYQEFTEAPQGAFVESFLWRDRVWGGNTSLWGTHAIRSDQALSGTYRKPRWTLGVDYRQTPHNLSFVTRTGYTLITPGLQVLPDSLQRANQENSGAYTSTMTDFLNAAHSERLGFRTDVLSARLKGRPGQGLNFELRGTRRNRSGKKPYGATFGFSNAIEGIEPIRQTMAEGEGRLGYSRNRVSVEAIADYSAFENDNNVLVWDNPRRLTDIVGTPSKGQLDLYPDNQAWNVTGRVGVQFPRRTAFTGSFRYGQSTQNDKWLPFTVNTAVLAPDTFPLPGTQTYAKANLTTLDARLTSHALSRAGATLRLHQHKYDNKTPRWTFSGQVPYDGTWNGTDVTTHPFGNEQLVYGVDLDWSPVKEVGLFGTGERIARKHTFREVPEDKENAFEGKVRLKPRSWVQADARYRHGKRELDEFDEEDYQNAAGQFIEQPDLRRYDVANRTQDLVEGSIAWTGVERVTVSANGGYMRNEYGDSKLGLQDDLRRSAGVDITLHATDRLDLSWSFGWVRMEAQQHSRQSSSGTVVLSDSTTWGARLKDELYSALGGVEFVAIPDRVTLNASYWYERSPGTYDLSGFEAASSVPDAQDLPGTVYLRQGVGLDARYMIQEGLEIGARWAWEEYDVTDFASQGITLLGPGATAVYLGDNALDYRANAVALAIKRTF